MLRDICKWHVEEFAYLVAKLKSMPEGDGTLFDHCCLAYVHEHAEANPHKNSGLAMIVAGGMNRLAKGRHTRITGTVGDVYLTLADEVLRRRHRQVPDGDEEARRAAGLTVKRRGFFTDHLRLSAYRACGRMPRWSSALHPACEPPKPDRRASRLYPRRGEQRGTQLVHQLGSSPAFEFGRRHAAAVNIVQCRRAGEDVEVGEAAIDAPAYAARMQDGVHSLANGSGRTVRALDGVGIADLPQRSQTGGGGDGRSVESALVRNAGRRDARAFDAPGEQSDEIGPAGDRRARISARENLGERGQVGRDVIQLLRTAR